MTTQDRALLAVSVVLIDLTFFVLPLTGLFVAYVLLVRPPWFLAWVQQLYSDRS